MISRRFVPFSILAAVLVILSLMGIPWNTEDPLGNFSGCAIYTAGDRLVELDGRYSLYGLSSLPSEIKMIVFVDGKAQEIGVDAKHGTFSGFLDIGAPQRFNLQAVLKVEGRVVARGEILLPKGRTPCVHIIRFTSMS